MVVVLNEPLLARLNRLIMDLVLVARIVSVFVVLRVVVGLSIMGERSFVMDRYYYYNRVRMDVDVVVYGIIIFGEARVERYVGMVNKGFRNFDVHRVIEVKHPIILSALCVVVV